MCPLVEHRMNGLLLGASQAVRFADRSEGQPLAIPESYFLRQRQAAAPRRDPRWTEVRESGHPVPGVHPGDQQSPPVRGDIGLRRVEVDALIDLAVRAPGEPALGEVHLSDEIDGRDRSRPHRREHQHPRVVDGEQVGTFPHRPHVVGARSQDAEVRPVRQLLGRIQQRAPTAVDARADWPDAIFGANDLVALGALQACLGAGIRVPEDLAIMGYDDIGFAAQAAVPLTTVRQPAYELGRVAAEILLADAGAGPDVARHVTFTPELIVRASA
ncbi:MAG: substrate-binding domain-containing protein [Microbacteriaceae bacterium]|nr:substrate-binding domain-containing protein [Microbacteriaceae bacterium]